MLTHAFYVSKSTFGPHNVADKEILREARANNSALSLTGCLFRAPNHYAQLLEGPRENVTLMLKRIKEDARHYDVIEWGLSEAEARVFPDWSMGFATSDRADMQLTAFGQAEQRPISDVVDILKRVFDAEYSRS